MRLLVAACLPICLIISSCGGGTDRDNSSVTDQLIANAGIDQEVSVNQVVFLDGSQSVNNISNAEDLDYNWSILSRPAGSSADLINNGLSANFTPDLSGSYVVSLTVSSDTENTNADAVIVSTIPGGDIPIIDTQGNEVTSYCSNSAGATSANYLIGSPSPAQSSSNPLMSLGLPDYRSDGIDTGENRGFVTLGCNGTIELEFARSFIDGPGNDLHIFEVGEDVEPLNLSISQNGRDWIDYGLVSGASSGVDISGVATADTEYRYIRLTDQGEACESSFPGADIDAVLVLNCR